MASDLEVRFFLLLFLMTIHKGNCARITMRDMLDELFVKRDYDNRIRPSVEDGIPTNITINYKIIRIMNINDVNMDFELIMYFRHKWIDPRLVHGYGKPVILEPESIKRVWQPDLTFVDAKREVRINANNYNVLVWIYEDGTVFKSVRLTLVLACDMSLERYPMDTQTCYIRVESYGHSSQDISLSWSDDEGVLDVSHVNVPKFDIVEARMVDERRRLIGSLVDYSIGVFYQHVTKITFKRKFFVQFINIYTPSMLIVSMSWVNFWIEPRVMTPRISVGLLTVLTMTTLTSSQLQDLPIMTYIRAVDVWIFSCLVFVICAFLETVLILVLLGKEQMDIPAEQAGRRGQVTKQGHAIATLGMSLYDLLDRTGKRKQLTTKAAHKDAICKVPLDTTRFVDRVCRVLFPAIFLGFCIIYFIYYMAY